MSVITASRIGWGDENKASSLYKKDFVLSKTSEEWDAIFKRFPDESSLLTLIRMHDGGTRLLATTTSEQSSTEMFVDGEDSRRIEIPLGSVCFVDFTIAAHNSDFSLFKAWEAKSFLVRPSSGTVSVLDSEISVVYETNTDTFAAAAGNDEGDSTIVVKETPSLSVSGISTISIDGDRYPFANLTGSTFNLAGSLSKSYSEDSLVRVFTGGWDILIDADDVNKAVSLTVAGEIVDTTKFGAICKIARVFSDD